MPRFFVNDTESFGKTAIISGRDAEHIRVLRLRPGEALTICDGRGTDYRCSLLHSDRDEAEVEIHEIVPCPGEPSIKVRVCCGLPKGDKTDYIIQKSVETGASEIVFFDSERVIQRSDGVLKKLERWNRISEEAAKQSGRGIIPTVSWMPDYNRALSYAAECDSVLFMYETGEREALSEAVKNSKALTSAAIITGPEGGFEVAEAESARMVGAHICSMGARILRCETAPVVALTALMFASGNLE